MNKKFKYTSLVAAGAVTLGLVGGTLAWFTSQDEVTNHFSTVGNNQDDGDSSIKIAEEFDKEKAEDITPGTNVDKVVQVKNVDNYEQFIKVSITVEGTNPALVSDENSEGAFTSAVMYNPQTGVYYVENYPEIQLTFTPNLKQDKTLGSWYNKELDSNLGNDSFELGDFYYIGKVAGESYTNNLLESVTLTKYAEKEYKNITFNVVVTADGIQTTNGAAAEQWELSDDLKELFTDDQSVARPFDFPIPVVTE